ncbi:hypothetical protein KAH43_00255 [Candidatus Bipolaricaulota bacterium]|nr:hypothetical protein [Candidatus Bipolaricaulota bacterium]
MGLRKATGIRWALAGLCIALVLALISCAGIDMDWLFGDPPPEHPPCATMAIADELELLVRGTSYETLRAAFGEPSDYREEWTLSSDGTTSEVEWRATFEVEQFDGWQIDASGTHREGLSGAWGARSYQVLNDTPAGEPAEPGHAAQPLRQLGARMLPEEVTERLGEPCSTEFTNGKPREMEFRFTNVWWLLDVEFNDDGVSAWYLYGGW